MSVDLHHRKRHEIQASPCRGAKIDSGSGFSQRCWLTQQSSHSTWPTCPPIYRPLAAIVQEPTGPSQSGKAGSRGSWGPAATLAVANFVVVAPPAVEWAVQLLSECAAGPWPHPGEQGRRAPRPGALLLFGHSVVFASLRPHGLKHARLPYLPEFV